MNTIKNTMKTSFPSKLTILIESSLRWIKRGKANQTSQYADDIKDCKDTQLLFRIDSWKPLLGRPRNKAILWTKDPSDACRRFESFWMTGRQDHPTLLNFARRMTTRYCSAGLWLGCSILQVHRIWFNEGDVRPRILCLIKALLCRRLCLLLLFYVSFLFVG